MASTYTPAQLELYLERIGYPNKTVPTTEAHARLLQLQQSIQGDALATLSELQRRHLGSIPWGNSALHYSQHHSISTHPAAVFEKLVTRRLDGYCMENTNLLYCVLRSLGYQVYPGVGRVSKTAGSDPGPQGPVYHALGHMVLFVTINGRKYMVDVGFGNNVPTSPLPLEENIVSMNISPTEMRLVQEPLPAAIDQSQKFWVYQIRYNTQSNWIPLYTFSEAEFLPQDFAMMNFHTSNKPTSLFTQAVLCVQLILDRTGNELEGLYILAGKEVKKRVHGNLEFAEPVETEEDRVNALAKWFGIHLQDHEVDGIQGFVSQLK